MHDAMNSMPIGKIPSYTTPNVTHRVAFIFSWMVNLVRWLDCEAILRRSGEFNLIFSQRGEAGVLQSGLARA